ncbi:unnamed protein product [Trichobilharzia regenti]|nr:unnamed protein product [Trichobilharzia regenti]
MIPLPLKEDCLSPFFSVLLSKQLCEGSRPGALIATCWASLMYHGENGYCESTKRIVSTTRYIANE